MTSKTHVMLGLTTAIFIKKYFPELDSYVVVTGVCIGSLLPDLDTQKSDPSQILPLASKIIDSITKHRGFTHTVLPFILIIFYYLFNYLPYLMLGIGAGTHLILDKVTLFIGITCKSKGEEVLYYLFCIINIITILTYCLNHVII